MRRVVVTLFGSEVVQGDVQYLRPKSVCGTYATEEVHQQVYDAFSSRSSIPHR